VSAIVGGIVIICAFDPVDELEGRSGVLGVEAELGGRLIAEHRAELVETYRSDSMRFVAGSTAFNAARDALRARRDDSTAPRRVRKTAKLES